MGFRQVWTLLNIYECSFFIVIDAVIEYDVAEMFLQATARYTDKILQGWKIKVIFGLLILVNIVIMTYLN